MQSYFLYSPQKRALKQVKATNTVKQLQKEAKAYNEIEVFYDVYSDRLNFIGSDRRWLAEFFRRRNVLADQDRGGYSIDIKDAIALGFPTKANSLLNNEHRQNSNAVHSRARQCLSNNRQP